MIELLRIPRICSRDLPARSPLGVYNDERALHRLAAYQTRSSSEIIKTNSIGNRLDIGTDA